MGRGKIVTDGYKGLQGTVLSATTISGTMVIGLAPVFLLWKKGNLWSFHLAVGFGILVGACLAMGYWPGSLNFFPGKYEDLLSANLLGTIGCFLLFYAPTRFRRDLID